MKIRPIFAVSAAGAAVALSLAYLLATPRTAQPPAFQPAADPYAKGIYANGIVESDQANGANMALYPEVAGQVTQIFVSEGQGVTKGEALLAMDDSVPRATADQQLLQADAALAALEQMKAQPRKESLDVAKAQVDLAEANLKSVQDQYAKQRHIAEINPQLVSKDTLDNALNAVKINEANLALASRQFALARAGAWTYDVDTQNKQYLALAKAAQSSAATLAKYTLRAPADGVVLAINTAAGSYISPQGVYNTYTQGNSPVIVLGSPGASMEVRCYIDEILINRLPPLDHVKAQMSVRGTDGRIPLQFVRVQPYVSPKIELTDQRQERVDLRVLPLVFRFTTPPKLKIYPGQVVDVYISAE